MFDFFRRLFAQPRKTPRIYVSSRRGVNEYSSRLVDELRERFDVTDRSSSEVSQCDVLVALIGVDWLTVTDSDGQRRIDNADDFVRIEIEAALQQRMAVIPVLLGEALMPAAEELPESLREITSMSGASIRLDPDWKEDVDCLIKGIEPLANGVGRGKRSGPTALPTSTGPISGVDAMSECKYAVVGEENRANLRLSDTLKELYGKENVGRFLELQHLEPFLAANQQYPIVVCLDLFGFDLHDVTEFVGRIRDVEFPRVVFNLYLDKTEYQDREQELPERWQTRFSHYNKTYKEDDDVEFEPIVRASLRSSQHEALHNTSHDPIRLTPVFNKGIVKQDDDSAPDSPIAFVSYSRDDWDGFVSRLVSDLSTASQKVWIDKKYILFGDDWLDAIGEALDTCDVLLLVLSPSALASRNVKIEYRYFFNQDKPIVPILYRQVEKLPFELAMLNYLDFTSGNRDERVAELLNDLRKQRQKKEKALTKR
jgi:hypothetical protein